MSLENFSKSNPKLRPWLHYTTHNVSSSLNNDYMKWRKKRRYQTEVLFPSFLFRSTNFYMCCDLEHALLVGKLPPTKSNICSVVVALLRLLSLITESGLNRFNELWKTKKVYAGLDWNGTKLIISTWIECIRKMQRISAFNQHAFFSLVTLLFRRGIDAIVKLN